MKVVCRLLCGAYNEKTKAELFAGHPIHTGMRQTPSVYSLLVSRKFSFQAAGKRDFDSHTAVIARSGLIAI